VSYDNDTEGTPVSILEASASGLPVVSTRHAGIPDVIIHERSGYIVEERDVEKMADYMIRLLKNPSLAKDMGSWGKENIRANFSMTRHISLLSEILLKACHEGKK
jgi:glycosyltransferase involved in cell wall biosynthesis